jgi:hypothetical protein
MGPGASTLSYDGGQVLIHWPSVAGYEFAAPQVGEQILVNFSIGVSIATLLFPHASLHRGWAPARRRREQRSSPDRDAGGLLQRV